MRRYLKLYCLFLQQRFKVYSAYRANFLIGVMSTIMVQGSSLLGLWVVMRHIPTLNGWTFEDLLLVYGLTLLSKAISHIFADGLWVLGRQYIQNGYFDVLLVRPINPLFHLLANRFGHEGIGTLLVGTILLIRAISNLNMDLNMALWLYIGISIISGTGIFISVNLITASTAFWIIDSVPIMSGVFEMHEFVKYPLGIYSKPVSLLLTWIIPFGFVSFYPASLLLDKDMTYLAWCGPLVAAILFGAGYGLWLIGLRHYTSTGT